MVSNRSFTVEGRQFRTETEYRQALRDLEKIKKLRPKLKDAGDAELLQMIRLIKGKKLQFHTLLGQDFEEEIEKELKRRTDDKNMEKFVGRELKKRDRRHKIIIALCSFAAAGCFLYLGIYSYYGARTDRQNDALAESMEKRQKEARNASYAQAQSQPSTVVIHYDNPSGEAPEVLEEYKDLLNVNKKLIGWLKIDDTVINYPVMQTTDNEYYLSHNLKQQYDQNGSIFMDKDCDVLKPSTNYILYGHHMMNGKMFGTLDKYKNEKYWQQHKTITFDTIYEHGTYEVMFAFQAQILGETDVDFKYYQFIDAYSATEFDSYMEEMAKMALYDTGVTAVFGDHLLTLSTCDENYHTNGRFVVVAKKIESE